MSKSLFNEFKPVSLTEWREKIDTDLKGKSYESLISETDEGIRIEPAYHSESGIKIKNFPFKKDANNWSINEEIYFSTAKEGNEKALKALSGGANSVTFIGELNNQNDVTVLLNDIMLDIIECYFECNLTSAEFISDYIQKKYTNPIYGGFCLDELSAKLYQSDTFTLRNVNAYRYHLKGANAIQEVALALAEGNELLANSNDANKVKFTFGSSTNYFLEIAKLRAFRILWENVLNAHSISNKKTHVHSKTSALYFSKLDINNNILRNTTQSMSSILGGCNTLTVLPHNMDSDSDFSNRIARNIQLILQEESYFNKISDPSNGSYYIEYLTQEICKKSWELFQAIESSGGFSSFESEGKLNDILTTSFEKKKNQLKDGSKKMVGVNFQQNSSDKIDISEQDDERLASHFEQEFNTISAQ